MTTFDLRQAPWIRVRELAGGSAEVSIEQALVQAHELRGISGELPTQDAAVLRLLLAVLWRSLGEVDSGRSLEVWQELWESPRLPQQLVSSYLSRFPKRFDLLDPTTPFFQVGSLEASSVSGLMKLVADVPAGEAYFTSRAGPALRSLSFAEAARWLVHLQAYDYSGIKTGAHGDARVKGGKGYPIGTGWTGALGLVVLEGATLKETLLLNLPLDVPSPDRDRPPWEREQLTQSMDDQHPNSRGPVDLLTWQMRRVRLSVDGERVVNALVCNGDPLPRYNQHRREPMCAWRKSANQAKVHNVAEAYMPRELDPERTVWRGLAGMLSGEDASSASVLTLSWLASLREDEILSPADRVVIRTVGMTYGTQQSSVAAVVDDRMPACVATLTDPELIGLAVNGVIDADKAVTELGRLAGNLARCAGADPEGPTARAREVGYSMLDPGYRRWFASLGPDSDITESRVPWQRHIDVVLRRVGRELVAQAGTPAWVGRRVTLPQRGEQLMDSSLVHLWFEGRLRGLLDRVPENPEYVEAT